VASDDDDGVTEAHDQRMTVHILTQIPEHEPVPGDPHYDLFMKAKVRLKRQGLWKCAINDDYCGGDIEMHHTHIESANISFEDLHKVNEAFGLHLDSDAEFADWIESPGNLEALCVVHHRTHYGIHVLPHPLWEPLRYRKANAKPSAELELLEGGDATEVDANSTTVVATKTRTTRAGTKTATKTDTTEKVVVAYASGAADETVEKKTVTRRTVPRQSR
jgi:hypothetical protein